MNPLKRTSTLLVISALSLGVGNVLATPSCRILTQRFSPEQPQVLRLPTDLKFKIKGSSEQVVLVNNAQETVVQQIIMAPGGHTGWHSHPGPVVVVIKSGQMSFYDGDDPTCTVRTYSAGQAFIDSGQGHVHIARNEGATNLELWATYFDVPPGGAFRIDAASPGNCPF